MSEFTNILSSALSGGITGLIGTVFTGVTTYLDKKALRKHELDLRNLDIAERKAEANIMLEQTNAHTAGIIAQGELTAFNTSLTSDRAMYATNAGGSWAFIFVDAVRGLMRPVLTMVLAAGLLKLSFDVIEALGGWDAIVRAQGMDLINNLIESLTFCTVTAVVWWFGGRATQKGLGR